MVAVEGSLIAAGLLLLFLLFGSPLSGGGDSPVADGDVAGAVDVSVRPGGGGGNGGGGVNGGQNGGQALGECALPVDRDFLSSNQIVTYYGNPYTADLGILGELPPAQLLERLKEQAQKYDSVNGFRGVQMGLHLVSTTAQPNPGNDGLYRLQVDMDTLREWVDLACENGLLLFLDLQIGQADLAAEIERIAPLLAEPHVELALDPEFAMAPGEIPGQAIGSYTAEEINQVQEVLEGLVEEKSLPDKILLVHQFKETMIDRPWDIATFPRVRTAVVMDGFGDPPSKKQQFLNYAQPAPYSGIKLFYKQDQPLMTEEEIARLRPDVAIYQ
jgi:hypothetical protein